MAVQEHVDNLAELLDDFGELHGMSDQEIMSALLTCGLIATAGKYGDAQAGELARVSFSEEGGSTISLFIVRSPVDIPLDTHAFKIH